MFLYQVNTGTVPPFVGVAVNILLDPEQIVVEELDIDNETTDDVATITSATSDATEKVPHDSVITHL